MTGEKKRKLHRSGRKAEETVIEQQPQDKPSGRMNIGVPIDRELWRRLRALAIMQGRVTGELLDEAIGNYLKIHEKG